MVQRRGRDEPEELTEEQRRELLGDPLSKWEESHFESEEVKRAAWEAHRNGLIEEYREENPGKRPDAWWQFEADRDRPIAAEDRPEGAPRDLPNEAAWLLEFGELGQEERGRCPPPSPAERAHFE